MVLISHKYKYIYIHIPKTGGMTIKETLPYDIRDEKKSIISCINFKNMRWKNVYHLTYEELADKYKIGNIDEYFIFTFVRNPYDRLYSTYIYSKKKLKQILEVIFPYILIIFLILYKFKSIILYGIFLIIILLLNKLIRVWFELFFIDFNTFIVKNLDFIYKLFPYVIATQSSYIKGGNINFIGREENFNKDLKFILNKYNLKNKIKNVNVLNESNNNNKYKYIDKFNKETIRFVNKYYYEDFKVFKYNLINV